MTTPTRSARDPLGGTALHDLPTFTTVVEKTPRELGPHSTPVTVYNSFVVCAPNARVCLNAWKAVAEMARTLPGCRSFQVLQDRRDDMFVALISEWDDMEAYTRFVHATGELWLERSMGHMCVPTESRFLHPIPAE